MSRLLHVLIHMDRHVARPTSEQISKMLGTNPVVVRRMMSKLRKHGLVTAERGHSGGWQLSKSLCEISLIHVYEAIGAPALFNIGLSAENPECCVEQAVDERIRATLNAAETLVREHFSEVMIEDIARDFEARMNRLEGGTRVEECGKG